jgi:hypothetical protein
MYGNKGPVDSETRRQTDPNLRARAGSGNVVTQTPRKLTDAEILAGFMRQGMGQIDRAVEGMNISFPTGMAGGGQKASDILAAQKFEYEKAQDRAAAERQARTLAAYQNMLSSGGYRTGTDQILGMIGAEGTRSQAAVEDAYKRALQNIAAGYETAQGLTTQGYGALEQFLRANPNNPYANVQVSAPEAPDAMQQILSAYGVAAEPVLAQVAAEQAAAQQGAAGFQNLLSTLGGAAQQADLSRLAEMEMARTLAGQTLGTQRATFSSQAEQARANALAEIEAQLAQARIQQEAAAIARRQQIEDAIAAAGGTIGGAGAGSGAGAGAGGETEEDKRRREALAQMLAAASSLGAGTGANMGPLAYAI